MGTLERPLLKDASKIVKESGDMLEIRGKKLLELFRRWGDTPCWVQ